MFKDSADNIIPWNTGTNGSRDGAISLGEAGGRFKDLYLSGGVVFGPASASNVSSQTLDSYEEGTWSPVPTQGTLTHQSATYTKIGRIVTVHGQEVTFSNTTSGVTLEVAGLPFTPSNSTAGGTSMWEYMDVAGTYSTCFALTNSRLRFYSNSSTGGFNALLYNKLSTGAAVYFTLTYHTNS